jgi:23S rRNA (cytosine1962-C5)-methyltransferase
VGLFPEHAALIPWLRNRILRRPTDDRPVQVLHLFAHTGLATIAMAQAGASVAHVDASRPTVAWARANAARNDLTEAPIRWLIDDARSFTAREVRRGRQYDGVVLDPPTYGHGDDRQSWSLERDLAPLMADIDRLLLPGGFVLLSAHTEGFDEDRLASHVRRDANATIEAGELAIDAASGARLRLGAFARWDVAR